MQAPTIDLGRAPDGTIAVRVTMYITAENAVELAAMLTRLAGAPPALVIPQLSIVPTTNPAV